MKEELELFAKNLNTYLEYYDLTQAELADRLGYSTAAVSHWCNGLKFPRLGTIDKMTELFKCRRSDLLEREVDPTTIETTARLVRLYKIMEKLNADGVDKVLTYLEDLNPKFYKDEGVSK